jgi:fluoride exporter
MGLWISVGGGLGAMARFAVSGWVTTWAYAGFPWGTFLVNVSGSALLGFLHRALPAGTASPRARGFFTIGLCGGYTTFSTFDFETFALLDAGRYALAGAYSLGSVATCVVGVLIGLRLAAVAAARGRGGWRP